jgi:LacI family transcriptional regulator
MLSEQRTRGFVQAHQDLGIPFNKEKILRCGDEDAQENFKIIQNALQKGMKFDGIFAVNDIAAVGALQALQAAQISVPQEVAIIGYSDWQFSSFISPTLTTIRQNGNEMGRKAAELLLEEIHSKDTFIEPKSITLPTEIILRGTTLNK